MFESVSIRGPFDLVMRLHQVQMIGDLVLHDIHIAGKHIIKAGVYGISRVNNLGGMMRGLNPLQFVPLYQGAVARSDKL